MAPDYVSLAEWCRLSGMSRATTYRRIGDCSLAAYRVGGRTMIDRVAGVAWLTKQAETLRV